MTEKNPIEARKDIKMKRIQTYLSAGIDKRNAEAKDLRKKSIHFTIM